MSGSNKSPSWLPVMVGGIVLIAIVVIYNRGPSFDIGSNSGRGNWPEQFQSNGEQIYFTARSSSGIRINAEGGGMHMQMYQSSCVSCHGADRQGRRLMPRFWITAPALTPESLFGGHDDNSEKDGHGDHIKYDAVTLKRAITGGIDPAGNSLDREMPRWTMWQGDLADLIMYLKSPVQASSVAVK